MTDTSEAILRAAERLAKRLDTDDTKTADLLDGLKVLAPYYTALIKGNGKDSEPPAGGTFAEMKRRLNDAADLTEQ